MSLEYRASIFANRSFGIFVVGMITALLGLTVFATAYGLALILAIFSAAAFVRLHARRMSFSADTMRYDGWLRTISIPISDVRHVKPASSYGYPTDRLRAGGYCVDTGMHKYWIHPIWFGPSACKELSDRFLRRRKDRPQIQERNQTTNKSCRTNRP
jgi:hypothetical protein